MKKLIYIIFFLLSSSYVYALDSFDIYKSLNDSTVRISIWDNYDDDQNKTLYTWGTGVAINQHDGRLFVLTNAHVMLEKFCFILKNNNGCKDKLWGKDKTITVDAHDSEYEYKIDNHDVIWWSTYDLAVIYIDIDASEFKPIKIGGHYHPLMNVYGAGYPQVLGNYARAYSDIVFCSGVVNTMFFDTDALSQLRNYSIAHSCTLAGGMSGGPLVDNDGRLLGINGMSGVAHVSEDNEGNMEVDIAPGRFDYAVDIWDLYLLEIKGNINEEGHFNPQSDFYKYLPKLSYDYHSSFYKEYVDLVPKKLSKIKLLFE